MSKTCLFVVIGGAIAAAAFVGLSVAAFLALPLIMERFGPEPRGAVLVYEVDPADTVSAENVDLATLTVQIDRRLNRGWNRLARVRQLDGQQIEVAVYDVGDKATRRVEQLLQRAGTLEFRILANDRDNKQLIDLALADPSRTQICDEKGDLLAWWVPVKAGEEKSFASYSGIARRTRKQDDREIVEILVLKDVYDVTGKYLTRADAGSDRKGQPCINFMFNSTGGLLFSRLTEDNLPDKVTNFTYKLGIILDGQLFSAPAVQGVIGERGEITGSFTVQEVKDLVSVLNAGTMEARIRLVQKDGRPADSEPTRP